MCQPLSNQCSKCRARKAVEDMALVKGSPRGKGICKSCRSIQRRIAYWRKRSFVPNTFLQRLNEGIVSLLTPGTYEVLFAPTSTPTEGYLTLTPAKAELAHAGKLHGFDYGIAEIARELTNRNLMATETLVVLTKQT